MMFSRSSSTGACGREIVPAPSLYLREIFKVVDPVGTVCSSRERERFRVVLSFWLKVADFFDFHHSLKNRLLWVVPRIITRELCRKVVLHVTVNEHKHLCLLSQNGLFLWWIHSAGCQQSQVLIKILAWRTSFPLLFDLFTGSWLQLQQKPREHLPFPVLWAQSPFSPLGFPLPLEEDVSLVASAPVGLFFWFTCWTLSWLNS